MLFRRGGGRRGKGDSWPTEPFVTELWLGVVELEMFEDALSYFAFSLRSCSV